LEIVARAANVAIFGVESVLVLWFGAMAVMGGTLSVGMLFAFFAYKEQFNSRMSSLVDHFFELRLLRLHVERLSDIVLQTVESRPPIPLVHAGDSAAASLEIRSLYYRYSDTDPWLLENINLLAEAGECIAITGRSGTGKSTLVKMISGLLQPQEGEVLLDGLPVRRMQKAGIAGRLAFVMQEDTLFSGSIYENIHFFDDAPDPAHVTECASLARIHDDIMAMPMGYNTLVGDMGAAVSGGQKQRLLLARALYSKPAILVLDEATSHLDLETEKQIAQTLRTLQLTRIMIAHRPQTVAIADRVFHIDGGRLVLLHGAVADFHHEFAP
jgi:ATP-binding cassette subfamily B protein RaxB